MVQGVGGVFGSLLGGVLTQYTHPKWSFLAFSVSGLALVCAGAYLSEEAEREQIDLDEAGSVLNQQQPQEQL